MNSKLSSKLSLLILVVLLFTFSIVISESALALKNCTVREWSTFPSAGYELMGYVSMQGHYSNNTLAGIVAYPYGLFCDDGLVQNRPDGVPTFNFSDPTKIVTYFNGLPVYGGGHITTTGVGVLFEGEARHGFTAGACKIKPISEGCGTDVCVLKTSSPNQGTVADCTDNTMPLVNNFQYKICCTPKEVCNDGIDNTGDGRIDCASPECHPTTTFDIITGVDVSTPPQQCAPGPAPGNTQSTSECVTGYIVDPVTGAITPQFSPHCMGPADDPLDPDVPFYCNYGFDDNSTTHPDGFCCPSGTWYNSAVGECTVFMVCGIGSGTFCERSFPIDRSGWLSWLYDGDAKWCHSQLPNLRDTIGRSEACCPVMSQGTFGYYVLDENVKIFGAN